MNIDQFKKILLSFADSQTDIETDKNEIVIRIRDEIIEITLIRKELELFVVENETSQPAITWIVNRLAKIHQLADRILDFIPEEKNFICPKGELLADIDKNPDEKSELVNNSLEAVIDVVTSSSALASNVLYITSDAGEGKTTLINELARQQAMKFKEKKSSWILVPIMLGGRPFLRFDDVIIASLVNRFRFPNYYYESFLELVKLGIIVPAFDGFEEMFMESSSGEALSALGQLMNKLDSQGSILIAARKAYFDFKSFTLQAKLFDTIGQNYVSFSKISLCRWEEKHFVEYSEKREVREASKIYQTLSQILSPEHSILTRAVLVKQLIDIIVADNDYEKLARQIKSGESENYFQKFVEAIIEREAKTKWIDRAGETAQPLISVEDHFYLLSYIAQEMWINNTDSLKAEILDIVTDMFAEQKKLSPIIHRQIIERIKQHALIINSPSLRNNFSFDHDEFREFFLGKAILNRISEKDRHILLTILKASLLPSQTLSTIVSDIKNSSINPKDAEEFLYKLCDNEGPISYARENLGAIILSLITGEQSAPIRVKGLNLPPNSLNKLTLNNIAFFNCYFQGTNLEHTKITSCNFIDCTFDRLEFYTSTSISKCKLENCLIKCVYEEKTDNKYYNPGQILTVLERNNFTIKQENLDAVRTKITKESDEKLMLAERVIRRFIKSTHLNENVFKIKLGKFYTTFENKVLPELLKKKILIEVEYFGSGNQKRFKLGKNMQEIEKALEFSNGNFDNFINHF